MYIFFYLKQFQVENVFSVRSSQIDAVMAFLPLGLHLCRWDAGPLYSVSVCYLHDNTDIVRFNNAIILF